MMFGRGYNGVADWCGGPVGFFGFHGGFLLSLVLIAAAVLITVYVMKKRPSHHDRTSDEVMESLNMRYIKGEIDDEEYLRRKQIIRQK